MAGLGDYQVGAVLRAEDIGRARRFYTQVLGLTQKEAGSGGETMFTAGDGTAVLVYERPGMPAPQNTTLGFSVPADKFSAVMDELRANGVMFEDYDIPEIGLKTTDGVAVDDDGSMIAWFKDTEGNIVSVGTM